MESLNRAFENVCELDLVFHFDEVHRSVVKKSFFVSEIISIVKVHHILAEIIQGGLVLETNVDDIDLSGAYLCRFFFSHLALKIFVILFSI